MRRTSRAREEPTDFIIQVALSDSHRGGRIELEILHLTAISHDRKVGHVNEVAFRILPTAGFHAEQSSHGRTRAAVNLNARAPRIACRNPALVTCSPKGRRSDFNRSSSGAIEL